MISFTCDWCGTTRSGYQLNHIDPMPDSWFCRRHFARMQNRLCESSLIACSAKCAVRLDKKLNVPHGIESWFRTSPTESERISCDSDDKRPVVPLNPETPMPLEGM